MELRIVSSKEREIGLGGAEEIETIEIWWHGGKPVQVFRNIGPSQFLTITEGSDALVSAGLRKIDWILPDRLCKK